MNLVNNVSKIIDAFEQVCENHPDRTAIIHLDGGKPRPTSFSELKADADRARAFLVQNGVRRGDRLLAFAESGYRLCVFLIACFELGACVMYVDIHAGQENMQLVFEKTRPSFVLVSNKTRFFRALFVEIKKINAVINIDRITNSKASPAPAPDPADGDDALITVTTGSTGKPKLFIRTHLDLFQQLKLVADNMDEKGARETVLTTSYIYIFANLLLGFTTVLPNVNLGSKRTGKIIRRLRRFPLSDVTMIITTPDFCLRTPNMYPKLKTLYCGGAILNRSEVLSIRRVFPCRLIHIYGSTECCLIASVDFDDYLHTLEKTGDCLLGDVCRGVSARTDENGIIFVKSDALLTKSTDRVRLSEGYYNTGDVGFFRDGRLYYLGKSGFCLRLNGRTVYSNEIEQRLILRFPTIGKCAAVERDGGFYLFLEDKSTDRAAIAQHLQKEYGANFTVKLIRTIPRDVKHHTKINYLKLSERQQ